MKSVKSLLGITASSKVPTNIGSETNRSVVVELNKTEETQESSKQKESVAKKDAKSEATEGVQKHKKFDITAVAQEENSSVERKEKSSESQSHSTPQESTTATATESNSGEEEESHSSSQTNSESNATAGEVTVTGTEINNSQEEAVSQESNLSESSVSESNGTLQESNRSTQGVGTLSKIKVKPLSKRLWLGIYNLDTHTRVNKFITSEIDIPIDGNYAIITGHNKFEISGDSLEVTRFPGKGRIYLLVSPEGIKKIDKSEYKQVTKNRAW